MAQDRREGEVKRTGAGRDPTGRRGEIEEGGSVSDVDVGADRIQRKAIGGYGAEEDRSEERRSQKPLTDSSREARGEPEPDNRNGT